MHPGPQGVFGDARRQSLAHRMAGRLTGIHRHPHQRKLIGGLDRPGALSDTLTFVKHQSGRPQRVTRHKRQPVDPEVAVFPAVGTHQIIYLSGKLAGAGFAMGAC